MTNDLIFWYTGWSVWVAISVVVLLTTLIACVIGIAGVYHKCRHWVGLRILRAYVSDPERHRIRSWPRLPKDIPHNSLMRWCAAVARYERKAGDLKTPIAVPAVTHDMIERAHRVYLDRDAAWKERHCSTSYDLAEMMLCEALKLPLPPERKFVREGEDR